MIDLARWIAPFIDPSFVLHSRSHELSNFGSTSSWFVKRDDELSFGVCGCKYRKYSSLLHHIKSQGIQKVALVGSAFSNHIVGLLQLLHEKKIDYHLYLRKPRDEDLQGNHLLIQMLSCKEKRTYLDETAWKNKDTLIPSWIDADTLYIPEGGLCLPSLYGAMTLAHDIDLNQTFLNLEFDHIFIDAGSGMSAIGLILGLAILEQYKPVHIILTYYDPDFFKTQLTYFHQQLSSALGTFLKLPPLHLEPSSLGKAFGSTPQAVYEKIGSLAKDQGILTDPIYSAKLFATAQELDEKHHFPGNKLIIHSGGALALWGFLDPLKKHLKL